MNVSVNQIFGRLSELARDGKPSLWPHKHAPATQGVYQ